MFTLRRTFTLLLGGLLLVAVGCTTQDLGGPSRPTSGDGNKPGDTGGDNGGGDNGLDAPADPRFTFTISASATSPYVQQGEIVQGPYDLYLWLVCSNVGLAQLQADFTLSGDELVPDHFFSPEGSVVSIVWQEYGQLNLAVNTCPDGEELLGRLHLTGTGSGVRIIMERPADPTLGAFGCADLSRVSGFSCAGYASDGNLPPEILSADGCAPSSTAGGYTFAISASAVHPFAGTAPRVSGPIPLYLWCIAGSFSALQGDIGVGGGAGEFDPVFSAIAPYLSLNLPDGPDVLLAAPGCSEGVKLLGSLWVLDDGGGVAVSMVPGPGGGAVDCGSTPTTHGFTCRSFSNR